MAPLNAHSLSTSIDGDTTASVSNDRSPPRDDSNLLYPLHLRPVSPLLLSGQFTGPAFTGDTSQPEPSSRRSVARGPYYPLQVPLSDNSLLASVQLFRRLNGTFRLQRLLHHPMMRLNVVFTTDNLFQPSKGRSNIGYSPYQLQPQRLPGAKEILEQTSIVECRPKDDVRYASFEVREKQAFVLLEDGTWEVHIPVHRSIDQGVGAAELNTSVEHWQKQVTLRLDRCSLQGYLKGETRHIAFNSVDGGGHSARDGRKDCMRITWTVTERSTELFEIRHWVVDEDGEQESGCVDELRWVS